MHDALWNSPQLHNEVAKRHPGDRKVREDVHLPRHPCRVRRLNARDRDIDYHHQQRDGQPPILRRERLACRAQHAKGQWLAHTLLWL
jgi:hypothetical protein